MHDEVVVVFSTTTVELIEFSQAFFGNRKEELFGFICVQRLEMLFKASPGTALQVLGKILKGALSQGLALVGLGCVLQGWLSMKQRSGIYHSNCF